ncbi:MAG: N-6 DNA methylase [Desulfonatronovibrio sp.]
MPGPGYLSPESRNALEFIDKHTYLLRSDLPVILAALIFLRWVDFQDAEQEAMAAFDEVDYSPVLPGSCHWRSWHAFSPEKMQDFFQDQLLSRLKNLSNSHHHTLTAYLGRIFPAIQKISELPPLSWTPLVGWLADQPFETQADRRALLKVFDFIIESTAKKHSRGWGSGFLPVPAEIAQTLVRLASPFPGARIYDPCFGLGSLLTSAWDYVQDQQSKGPRSFNSPFLSISGVEQNSESFVIGLTRIILSGVEEPRLELGNSLERTPSSDSISNGFDLVLANPPIGMRVDPTGMGHYPVRTRDGAGLFIQHALSQLKPDGLALIIVPEGLLFSRSEVQLRRMLVEKHTVEAVISLTSGAFMPYTGIKTNILIIRRGGETKKIRMLDAEPYFSRPKGSKAVAIQSEQINELVQKFRSKDPAKHSWDVEATDLEKIDYDLTPMRRDLSALTGVLDSLPPEVEILKLGEICRVMAGRSISSKNLLDYAPFLTDSAEQIVQHEKGESIPEKYKLKQQDVPYVRIKDIQHGYASKASSWLAPETASDVDPKWKLKSGDLLVSKSGTIGKAGLVRNGAVGAIASSGLLTIRPEQDLVDPHFLLAYLDSNECKKWLDAHARGTTIRHLSRSTVEELPIPVPPIQIQQSVARRYLDDNINALTYLVQILTRGEQDPIADWLDKIEPELSRHDELIEDPLDLSFQDSLASSVSEIRNQVVREIDSGNPLRPWFVSFVSAISSLQGIGTIPPGTGLLSVLQESIRALDYSYSQIKGNLPTEEQARNVTRRLTSQLQWACDVMFDRVELYFSTSTAELRAGEASEISITVENQGFLPLRNLIISTEPDWGSKQIAYLAEGQKAEVSFSGTSPDSPDDFIFNIFLNATTLDGREKTLEHDLSIKVNPLGMDMVNEPIELGKSPYFVSQPVGPDRQDVFFGREALIEQIKSQISSGNTVLLEGNRRSGKTSILKHLEGTAPVKGWLGVYCSFQGASGSGKATGMPTDEVWREIARSIAQGLVSLKLETPLPDGKMLLPGKSLGIERSCRKGITLETPWADFREYLGAVMQVLARKNLGLLLMLDEFDKLQEGIDNGVTSPQTPENIRYLIQSTPNLTAILTGALTMRRLREEYWSALYGLGHRIGVSALDRDSALKLVTEPVKDRLTYFNEAAEHVVNLTSRQPYLLQCLCNRIFEQASLLKTRTITLDLVNKAGLNLVKDNEHLAALWRYAGSPVKRFILALLQKNISQGLDMDLGLILESLLHYGVEISEECLIEDLEFLRRLELIRLKGQFTRGKYTLEVPLMGLWIEKNQDFAAVLSTARKESEEHYE